MPSKTWAECQSTGICPQGFSRRMSAHVQGRSLQCSLEKTNVEAALQPWSGCNPSAQLLLFTEEISNKSRQHEVRPQPPLTLETHYLPSETHKHKHTRKRTHAYIHQKYSLCLNVTKFTSERDPAESQRPISETWLPKGPKDFQEPCNLNTRYNPNSSLKDKQNHLAKNWELK